jgi:hypothetical protein
MSYISTAPGKSSSRSGSARWVKAYKYVLAAAAYVAVVALITLAQVANDRLAGDVNAPFSASASQAF